MNVVHEFLDILQNIETAITGAYIDTPEINDQDVMLATEKLISAYTREKKKLPVLPVSLAKNSLLVYQAMKDAAESRLTREANEVVDNEVAGYKIPLRLVIVCLERLHKSMLNWRKEGGYRGYLNYIKGFTS